MWDIKLHDLFSRQSRHVDSKLISNQFNETIKFFTIIISLILLYFDEFNGQLREDNLTNIKIYLRINKSILILKVSQITSILTDCIEHSH